MYEFAFLTLRDTAAKCGLVKESVYQELEDEATEEVMLPTTRLEVQILEEALVPQGWRVARTKSANGTVKTRWSRYRSIVSLRAVYRSDNQRKVEDFCRELLIALPSKIKDAAGNWIRIEGHRAERKNYTFATIRIEEKPFQALHINITGIIYRDVDAEFIDHVNLKTSFNGEPHE